MAKTQRGKNAGKTSPVFQEARAKNILGKKSITLEKTAVPKKPVPEVLGIKKEYLKGKKTCRVTFRLPKAAAPNGNNVYIVGDFNNWNIHTNPMKKAKNEGHTITLDLEPGREYQFRYLIDDSIWENDWNADNYVRSSYGDCDNSVVCT